MYSEILPIKRNKIESVVVMQMHLESVIQSEVIQKDNSIYINAYIWNPDSGTDEPTCRAGIEMQTQRMDLCTWGEGEG